MSRAKKENTLFTGEFDYSILIGCLSCFDIVSNTGSFTKWMHDTYPSIKNTEILDGYQYFIELLIGMIANSLRDSEGIGLNNHDIMFDRALFYGISPDKTQPTNDLGKLFVILQKRVEQIKKTGNINEFRNLVKKIKDDIVSVFDTYVDSHTSNSSPFSNDEGKLWCKRAFIWVFLVNIRTGVPQAHIFNPLRSGRPNDIIEEGTPKFDLLEYHLHEKDTVLRGFCYVLEYLIREIFPNYLNDEMLTRLHTADNWTAVDLFYTELHNDFFTEKYNEFAWYFHIFKAKSPLPKKQVKPILKEYQKPELSPTEQLEQEFLWYEIGFLDATSVSFTGHVAFSAMLDGEVKTRMKQKKPEPIQIRVIKHPVPEGNYYSYAILLEQYGMTDDKSGWIVCYNCSTDFSGTGGYYNALIQNKLDEHNSILEIKEYSVDESKFKRFCLERDVSSREDVIGQQLSDLEYMEMVVHESKRRTQKIEMKLGSLEDKVNAARGLLTELLTYYHISKSPHDTVDWNITHNSKELDVIYSTPDKKAVLIECKCSDNLDLDEEFKKLAAKIEACTLFAEKPEGVFYFYQRLMPKKEKLYSELREKYRKKGVIIQEYIVLSDLLMEGKSGPSVWSGKDLNKVRALMKE